jgi:AbrB family looped-hinge helix DNA binding protein
MRITSKGQVTIPQEIRERAGLLPHTEVAFDYSGGQVILRRSDGGAPKQGGRIRAAIEKTRGSANEPLFKGWSTDRIMAYLRPER